MSELKGLIHRHLNIRAYKREGDLFAYGTAKFLPAAAGLHVVFCLDLNLL